MNDLWVSEPKLFVGKYWAGVTLEKNSERTASEIPLHISISVSPDDKLVGADIGVVLLAGTSNEELSAVEQLSSTAPLGIVATRAVTAYAHYVFSNPSNADPHTLVLRVQGDTKSFDLHGPSMWPASLTTEHKG